MQVMYECTRDTSVTQKMCNIVEYNVDFDVLMYTYLSTDPEPAFNSTKSLRITVFLL